MFKLPRVLLLGASGQVGWELKRALMGMAEVISSDRKAHDHGHDIALDLCDVLAVKQTLIDVDPDMIVNAAAYTAVDLAEQESALAFRVNTLLPEQLANYCAQKDRPLVHYSTDYIFDGQQSIPYLEQDKANPQGVYGVSKLAGEQAIVKSNCQYLILRTSWVYGTRGNNFMRTMLKLAEQQQRVKVVSDQVGAPTWSKAIANATALLLLSHRLNGVPYKNIFHLTCGGQCSWATFAEQIFANTKQKCEVQAITTADYPTPAIRPAYTVLSNEKLTQHFGFALPQWQQCLSLCLEESRFAFT